MAPTEKELEAFRGEVKAWFEENRPPEPDFLLPQSFMEVGTDEQFYFLRDWQNKVYEAGYLGMAWPEAYGGRGMDQAWQNVVTREMVRQQVPFMVNTIGLNWAGPLILMMGSEEQKKRYIPNILSAEEIWCQGFSEPDHGSDLGNAQLKAERDGDEFVLNGSKIWTSLGRHAKHMILLARSNPEANSKYEGLSFFLAPMDVPGIDVVPIKKMTGEYGFNQTFFTDARIPASTLIGGEGNGWKVAMATLMFERGASGGQAGGHAQMQRESSHLIDLARRSKRGGKPAIEDPLVRDQLVKFVMRERSVRLNSARSAHKALTQDRPHAISISGKYLITELTREMNEYALSLQGTNGAFYVGDPGAVDKGLWHRAYFNAFSATIGGGTSQIQQNIIGERVLGLPKS
ncbi:MAG: acyl-CoA dehydrogenase [Alphaproteobacteria bacterium]|nr:MAG: acyl-CoA dehydrogenase [Alphaproteobacteria bacterium]